MNDFDNFEPTVIYTRVTKFLKERQESGVQMCKTIGITPHSYWNLKYYTPNAVTLYQIANYLGTTVEYLISGNGPEYIKRGTSIPIEINDKELQLLQSVKLLTDEQKDYVIQMVHLLPSNENN